MIIVIFDPVNRRHAGGLQEARTYYQGIKLPILKAKL